MESAVVAFKNGWYKGKVSNLHPIRISTNNYIKIYVDLDNGITASNLCKPHLLPGNELYKWVRVCDVQLEAIDTEIHKHAFIDKDVQVYVVRKGDYYNIIDVKKV